MGEMPTVWPLEAPADGAASRMPRRVNTQWWLPSLADCFFIAVLVWLFAAGSGGWAGLLADADAGWHIRTGEYILDHGSVPRTDLFSFSKPGQPWYAWEWLSDVGMAVLHRAGGLKAIVLFAGLLIAATSTLLLRHLFWRGANAFVALVVVLLAAGASSIHYLARPHVTTLLLVALSMWILDRDRRNPSPWVWTLVPVSALWTNLHGGFLALLAVLALAAVGTAAEAWMSKEAGMWRQAGRYTLLAGLSALATLVNPYGVQLHVHIAGYLRSDWIRQMVQEFQSPSFRNENLLQFEALLFVGIVCAGFLLARRKVVEALWILFWAHQALGSARHVPIFAIVAAPMVACELTRLWDLWVAPVSRRSVLGIMSSVARDIAPGFRRSAVWVPLVAVILVVLNPAAKWPQDFPEQRFPVNMVSRQAELLKNSRVFTSDQWADYLIYHFYPTQRVFFDGRSDFYGPAIGDQYVHLFQGRYDWEQILDRHGFDVVLSPVEWPLCSLLKREAGWRLVADDGKAVLFARRGGAGTEVPRTGPSPSSATVLTHPEGLMNPSGPAEREMGYLRRQ